MNSEMPPDGQDVDDRHVDDPDIAALLEEIANGEDGAAETLMPLVYDRLRFLAKKLLGHESPAHTLQPTALVNEAYLRMVGQRQVEWQGKTHFFAIGAKMMRRILVDHARRKLSHKRGGGAHRIELADDLCVSNRNNEDILAIEDALEKLANLDPRQAQVVELRFYGGLTVEEVAEGLGVSKRTVESDWTMLRAWLRRELSGETPS
jgi:RNA polymerase sigma factor (TIGR02999 family)